MLTPNKFECFGQEVHVLVIRFYDLYKECNVKYETIFCTIKKIVVYIRFEFGPKNLYLTLQNCKIYTSPSKIIQINN